MLGLYNFKVESPPPSTHTHTKDNNNNNNNNRTRTLQGVFIHSLLEVIRGVQEPPDERKVMAQVSFSHGNILGHLENSFVPPIPPTSCVWPTGTGGSRPFGGRRVEAENQVESKPAWDLSNRG